MPVTNEFLEHVLDILRPLGAIRSRPMMGGHCLYCDNQVFALIDDDTLYFKVSKATRPHFVEAGLPAFAPDKSTPDQTMSYHVAPAEVFDDADAVKHWGTLALAAGKRANYNKPQSHQARKAVRQKENRRAHKHTPDSFFLKRHSPEVH
ncbi:MAG: TfoX/Sxy family protein [Phycisphaerae bacterium]|jgi:DNA transformation protein